MIEEIYRIVKIIEINLKKDIGEDKYEKEKENVEMPKSFAAELYEKAKELYIKYVPFFSPIPRSLSEKKSLIKSEFMIECLHYG